MYNLYDLHVELTSRCTLECPLCDRTWFYNKFKKRLLHQIDVSELLRFVGSNKQLYLCGNNGDPIYHPNFLNLCTKLKQQNNRLMIVTNGSAKKNKFWTLLGKILKEEDEIQFSIDGLKNTNHLYRKNSNWDQIMEAVQIMSKSTAKMTWQFIVFKHNQHQIEEARQMSKDLGFQKFVLYSSDRWNGETDIMPDSKYINESMNQNRDIVSKNLPGKLSMKPKCIKDNKPANGLYIDSEGDFYPCCWMGTYRYKYKSIFDPKHSRYNIKNNSLDAILSQKSVREFFDSTKQFTSAHDCCKIQCGVKNG
jgi:MoaA/NifB/PqqE/SkfB family radical SAM enzyme